MRGRGQSEILAALQDLENCLPFLSLVLDSDNAGEFLNLHVLGRLQKRDRPVSTTRRRPYKNDDNAHMEQKNWALTWRWFVYERHETPEVIKRTDARTRGP
jgi:hypothetical protein